MTPRQLKVMRAVLGMTQQEFADAVYVHKVTLADLERRPADSDVVSPKTVAAIAAFIGQHPSMKYDEGVLYVRL